MMEKPLGYIISEAPLMEPDAKVIDHTGNRVIAQGTLQDADAVNRNGRIYEMEELFPALKDSRLTELLKTGNLKGEDGHPLDKSLLRQQTIHPPLTSVKFLDIWTEGKLIKAKFKGTNTCHGQAFNDDLLDHELPSFSLRALGSLMSKNGKNYVKNMRIITWDRVIYPSHKLAYTEKIVAEGANLVGDVLKESMESLGNKFVIEEDYAGELDPIMNQQAIDYIKEQSCNIKSVMNTFETLGSKIKLIENGTKVQLITPNGDVLRVHCENYITNEIMNYCCK